LICLHSLRNFEQESHLACDVDEIAEGLLENKELIKIGEGILELMPVEIDTSVTDLPRGRGQLLGWNWDRVWPENQ
jgi:hypothetical protein